MLALSVPFLLVSAIIGNVLAYSLDSQLPLDRKQELDSIIPQAALGKGIQDLDAFYQTQRLGAIVDQLKASLGTKRAESMGSRLAISIPLFLPIDEYNSSQGMRQWSYLSCSMPMINTNIAANTPADIFLWVRPGGAIPDFVSSLLDTAIVIQTPPDLLPTGDSTEDIARFRLMVVMPFLKLAGYKYSMSMTVDTFAHKPIPSNIIHHMASNGIAMAVRNKNFMQDLLGMPELTSFWMLSREMVLRTTIGEDVLHVAQLQQVFPSSGAVVDLNFWFHPVVQSYVTFVLHAVETEEGFLDIGLLSYVRLLFVKPKQLHKLDGMLQSAGPPHLLPSLDCPASTAMARYAELTQTPVLTNSKTSLSQTIWLRGGLKQDVLYFQWNCEDYEDLLGPCNTFQNIHTSIMTYITAFCRQQALDVTGCEGLIGRMMQLWRQEWGDQREL